LGDGVNAGLRLGGTFCLLVSARVAALAASCGWYAVNLLRRQRGGLSVGMAWRQDANRTFFVTRTPLSLCAPQLRHRLFFCCCLAHINIFFLCASRRQHRWRGALRVT